MLGDLTAPELLRSMWARRRFVTIVSMLSALAFLLFSLLFPAPYVASVTLIPQMGQAPAGILGELAGLAGLPLEYSSTQEELYGEILRSDVVLDGLIEEPLVSDVSPEPRPLYALLRHSRVGQDSSLSAKDRADLKEHLRKNVISFTRDVATGFMKLKVKLPEDPSLCAAVANGLADGLDRFNRTTYRSKASEQREFIENRLLASNAELAAAETALTGFVAKNRAYASSPQMLQQYGMLEREVSALRAIWVELKHQLELARIEENKQMPTLHVLDPAAVPVERTGPGPVLMVFLGLVLGPLAAFLFLAVAEQIRRLRKA